MTTNPIAPVIARLPAQRRVKATAFTALIGEHVRLPPNVAVEGAPAREARREPKSDALRRSPRTAGWTAACKAPRFPQCTPGSQGPRSHRTHAGETFPVH
jgi:hypothetical protein